MNFDFTSEQKMLATTVARCLSAAGTLRLGKDGDYSRVTGGDLLTVAGELGQLGVLGLLAPEECGGTGLGMVDAMAAAIEAGRLAAPFPLIETMVAAACLAKAQPDRAREVLGGRILATCASEGELVPSAAAPALVVGSIVAPYLRQADIVLAPLRLADGKRRIAIFDAAALDIAELPPFDLTSPLGEARLIRPTAPVATVDGDIERVLAILACGDLVGAAEECLIRAVAYMKTRVQFDSLIGKNQALKHMAADDHVLVESMLAAAQYSAWTHDAALSSDAPEQEADLALHVAKAYCSAKAKKVAEDAIQIHGGIGFTWEQGLHVFLRRIQQRSNALGSTYHHNDRLADIAIASAQRARSTFESQAAAE